MLVFENTHFGIGIGLKVRVPIQMIRRYVQQNAHFRPESDDGVELKAADFRHNDLSRLFFAHVFDQRVADIAADKYTDAGIFEHLT